MSIDVASVTMSDAHTSYAANSQVILSTPQNTKNQQKTQANGNYKY